MRSKHIGRTKSKWRIPFFLALATVITVLLLGSTGLFNKKEPVKSVQVAAQPEEKEEPEEQETAQPLEIEKAEVDPFEQLIQTAEASIYGIESDLSLGTAFLINEKGDLVTNAHIVKGSVEVNVLVSENETVTGAVIGYSEEQDIALIRVEAFEGRLPLRLETEQTAQSGEPVLTFRHQLTEEQPFIKGTLDQEDAEYYVEPYFYQQMLTMKDELPYTTSGGPLLHEKWGTVVGLSTTRPGADGFVHFHVPVKQFAELLEDWSKTPLTEEELLILYEEPAEALPEEEVVEEEPIEEPAETTPVEETEQEEPSSWSPPSRTTPAPSGGGTSAPPASTPSTPVTPPPSEPVEEPAEEPVEEVPDEIVEEPVEEPVEEEPAEDLPEEPSDAEEEE